MSRKLPTLGVTAKPSLLISCFNHGNQIVVVDAQRSTCAVSSTAAIPAIMAGVSR